MDGGGRTAGWKDLIVGTALAVMNGGETLVVEEFAAFNLGEDDPVVSGFHALGHLAFDARERLLNDGATVGFRNRHVEVAEAVLSRCEGLEERLHDNLFATTLEYVEVELASRQEEAFDGALLCDGDGERGRIEARLRYPRGKHGALYVFILRRHGAQ